MSIRSKLPSHEVTALEEFLRETERMAKIGSWSWDLTTGEVNWSQQMYAVLGYTQSSRKPTAEELFAALDLAHDSVLLSEIYDTSRRQSEYRDCRLLRPDGSTRYVTLGVSRLTDDSGKLRRLIGTLVDRTEHVQVAEDLRQANHLLEEAQTTAHVGSWQTTLSTGETQWSKEAERIFGERVPGLAPEEVFRSRINPEDLVGALGILREATEGKTPAATDARLMLPNGSVRYLRVKCVPLFGTTGVARTLLGTLQDITEQVELQAKLVHSSKMEALGRLASGIAHDFNNLLAVVMGNLELLEAKLKLRTVELGECYRALGSARSLTKRLLALGGRAPLDRRSSDLNTIARSTVELLQRVTNAEIEISLELEPHLPHVLVDPLQIEQALINLIVNARDALVRGGKIRVGSLLVEDGDEQLVELYVADNGPGIPKEIRHQVFEPFFTTKSASKGSGLGLSTVFGTVEQHGGQIELVCPDEGGATFRMRFPVEGRQTEEASDADPSSEGTKGPHRVLVVDDDAMVASVILRTVENAGYLPTWVNNPADAIRVCTTQPGLRFVVCDVRMPEMSGPELIVKLMGIVPDLRVLFVTGYSDEQVAGTLPGPVVNKPFTSAVLVGALDALVRSANEELHASEVAHDDARDRATRDRTSLDHGGGARAVGQ